MNRNGSLRSFASSSQDSAKLSAFQQILPQSSENMELRIPRGMRFTHSSQLAGCGKMAKIHAVTGRSYNFTVEPLGRKIMPKEFWKFSDELQDEDSAKTELPEVRFNDAVLDAIIDERHHRTNFRKERLRKFASHRFVPALVTERLVPCWRAAGSSKDAVASNPAQEASQRLEAAYEEMRARSKSPVLDTRSERRKFQKERRRRRNEKLVTPTMSVAMKRQEKVEVPPPCWRPNGILDVHDDLHPQQYFESGGCGPMWEEVEKERVREHWEAKKQWLSHDVLPAGIAMPWSEGVQEVRELSKSNLQGLRLQYDKKRNLHKKSINSRTESGFEKYLQECKAKDRLAAAEAARAAATEKASSANKFDLGGLGLSLGKQRAEASAAVPPDLTAQPN